MRAAILTTETAHHAFFVRELADAGIEIAAVVLDLSTPNPRFPTFHPYEDRRDDYERETLLQGRDLPIASLAPTTSVATIDDPAVPDLLARLELDVVFVYGTSRLGAAAIAASGSAPLNFHGGDPEEYRGLDTHLWAIYHRDFERLVTTLHQVDEDLDTGAIILRDRLVLTRSTELHELRALTAQACVAQALRFAARPDLPVRQQRRRGRYYSFMPAVLKDGCVEKLAAHVATL